jgi:hypothetical protein
MVLKKRFKTISVVILFLLFSFFAPKANAANLTHISDTVSTTSPSALAKHAITFTTVSAIPIGGKIIITFPGSGDNTAIPSATTFAFNNLQTTNLSASFSGGSSTCTFYVSAPAINCMIATTQVSAGTTVTITVGSTTPTLINPTKSAADGTADIWKVWIRTVNALSVRLDTGRATIGTIESVRVEALVEPTLTFSIAPVSGAINTGNATGCTNSESVNSGISSTTTTVNLGSLNNSSINISAQLITISTNGLNGYVLTATSSGHLINPSNGVWIPDSTTPTAMAINVPWFGIHPCGLNVNAGAWGTGTTGGGVNAKYAWPTITNSLTLASATNGPIGDAAGKGGVGAGLTSVEYAGAVNASIPAGIYTSAIIYTATPTF